MPGLFGFTSLENLSPQKLDARLQKMKDLAIIPPNHEEHDILFGPQTAGTLLSPNRIQTPQTFQNSTGMIAWFEGQLYNREILSQQHNWHFENDIEFLISLLTNPEHKRGLKNVDGLFNLIVLDAHKNQLHILTDRYGLRPLFLWQHKNGLSWASESKAFLGLPGFTPKISRFATTVFLTSGQLPHNQTWLENVTLAPPATHIVYNTQSGQISRERYWWWDQVTTKVGKPNLDDLAEEFGTRFKKATELRANTSELGLLLSGGLDSRAVFAAMPGSTTTFTFGQPNSAEVAIAKEVAETRSAPHHILALSEENWLNPRFEGVWWTDGALNILHMHGIEHLNTIANEVAVCFNGAGGDGFAGGGHLFESHLYTQYLQNNLHIDLDSDPTTRQSLEKAFQNTNTAHGFYVDWRMRGFTIHGPRLGLFKGVDYRLPFLDNELQEFLFGLPLSVKQDNKLYRHMLLKTFPNFFEKIPWAKTGKPIGWSNWALKTSKALQKIKRTKSTVPFTNYPQWLRHDYTQKIVQQLLLSNTARSTDLISNNTFSQLWSEHQSETHDHTELIGRYLTLEIYTRQVLDKTFRSSQEIADLLPISN